MKVTALQDEDINRPQGARKDHPARKESSTRQWARQSSGALWLTKDRDNARRCVRLIVICKSDAGT